MKKRSSSFEVRSLFALGLGCALTMLPVRVTLAQAAESAPPVSAGTDAPPARESTVPTQEKSAGEAIPAKNNKAGVPVKGSAKPAKLTLKEKTFMRMAAGGNAAEVQMAELAAKNAESQKVKDFAQMMIKDHTEANENLMKVAQEDGMANFKAEVSDADKALYAKMTKMTGTAFDTAYIKHAVADHTTDVKEYKAAMSTAKDANLKGYVEKTTPIIEGHLKEAKSLESTKTTTVNS